MELQEDKSCVLVKRQPGSCQESKGGNPTRSPLGEVLCVLAASQLLSGEFLHLVKKKREENERAKKKKEGEKISYTD